MCVRISLPGASLFGTLDCAGIGEACVTNGLCPGDEIKAMNARHNKGLFAKLGDDPLSGELLRLTLEEAKLGRMTTPVKGA